MSTPLQCVVILGPTASGKTRLGVALARHFAGEIVSADCRQVYRGLDIGTGKDVTEYGSGPDRVAHHLIDVVHPDEEYHLFGFLADARHAIRDIVERGKLPIVVGGTAMYLNALLSGYQPEGGGPDTELRAELARLSLERLIGILEQEAPDLAARTDTTQKRRVIRAIEIARSRDRKPVAQDVPFCLNSLLLGPYHPRATMHKRIAARLDERLHAGLLEEVVRLHNQGITWERLDELGLEYRYAARHLQGELTGEQMRETLLARIRRFCRAQDIWFRKMEREGRPIHWIPQGDVLEARNLVRAFLHGEPLPKPRIRLVDVRYGPSGNR